MIYVTRHGQTNWNLEKKVMGRCDEPLNETGINQAKETRDKLNDIDFDLIICSPLKRAKETAQIINENRNIDIIYDDRIIERDFGEFEGLETKNFDFDGYWDYYKNIEFERAENIQMFFDRVYLFLDDIVEKYKDKNILIVAHGGISIPVECYFKKYIPSGSLVENKLVLGNCEFRKYNTNRMEEYLEFAKDVAYYAGKIMIKYFKEDNGSEYKFDNTIVTKADKEINTYLINRVKEVYPDTSVDGEEEQFGSSSYVWVCDPVDGTAMYARHIPVAVFSLALVHDGIPVLGVVYDPFTDNMYSAIKGSGAYLNGKEIRVSDIELDDMRSVSNMDIWPEAEYEIIDVIKELGKKTYFVGIGSVIHAGLLVASGEFNLALFPGTKHKNCDIAAIKVIVEEAGGIVRNIFGEEQRYDQDIKGAIISNKVVYDEVLEVMNKYMFKK